MRKSFIRTFAFFAKEINEVRRQPRLVLALILGPFLILLLFGLGYQATPPRPRAILVLPDAVARQVDVNALKYAANLTYELADITPDENAAMARLRARQVDVVEVIPADVQEQISKGYPASVEFRYADINPVNEMWYQSLGYAQVNEINKALLTQTTAQLQQEAKTNQAWISAARQQLDALSANTSPAEMQKQQATVRRLRQLVGAMAASPLLASQMASNGQDPQSAGKELTALASDLDALDKALGTGSLAQEQGRLTDVRSQLAKFDAALQTFARMSPQVIVAPLQPRYENQLGQSLSLTLFYAPGVLALILQHIAVTLGALSLVRERLLGALELFRVTPVSPRQVLIGKYLAYVVFVGVIAAGLTIAMSAIQVPFRGSMGAFAGILILLILSSLGVGLLISTISRSDTQAIQLSMLVLLLSIFFSGFFLPLENFWLPVRVIGYLLPLTPAILGLQDIMLRGTTPDLFVWLLLVGQTLFTFSLVSVFASRQLRYAALV